MLIRRDRWSTRPFAAAPQTRPHAQTFAARAGSRPVGAVARQDVWNGRHLLAPLPLPLPQDKLRLQTPGKPDWPLTAC